MEKVNKIICNLQKDSSYVEYLKSLKKDELDYIRKTLKIKGVSKLKKEELAEVISKNIVENLEEILDTHAKVEEKNLYNTLIQNDGFMMLTEDLKELAINLRTLGITFFIKEEDKVFVVVPKEIVNLNNDTSNVKATECDLDSKWAKATCGLLYFYGVMDKEELYKKVSNLLSDEIELNQFVSILENMSKGSNAIKISNNLVASKDVINAEKIKKDQNERGDIEFYNPSLEEVMEASSENYIVCNKYTKELHEVLAVNPKLTGEDEKALVKKCFDLIRNNFNFMDILEEFSHYVGFSSMEEGNKFIKAVQQLENNSRLWVLKGNTTEEVVQYKKKQMNLNSNTYDLEAENNKEEETTIIRTGKKIGRNEPCPCGSGKKYKKCCGKN